MTPVSTSKETDPRIVSPTIRVVYPSAAVEKSDSPVTAPVTAPVSQTVQPETTKAAADTPLATDTQVSASQPASTTTADWKQVIKQNLMLFLLVGAVALSLGILIGKKL